MNEGAELALGTVVERTVTGTIQDAQTRSKISSELKEQYKTVSKVMDSIVKHKDTVSMTICAQAPSNQRF